MSNRRHRHEALRLPEPVQVDGKPCTAGTAVIVATGRRAAVVQVGEYGHDAVYLYDEDGSGWRRAITGDPAAVRSGVVGVLPLTFRRRKPPRARRAT